tara:strand:- start:617 stop:1618 length:1002 start_codon:yes stop_codon:yes gene_type:complete
LNVQDQGLGTAIKTKTGHKANNNKESKIMTLTRTATAISLSLLATAAIAAEPKVDVYGSVRLALDKEDSAMSSDDKLTRFGIKASSDIGHGLTAVGGIEYGVDFEQKSAPTLRLGYVGVKGALGELYHGSQTTVWHKFVRGAYFSNGSDSLRMYTIRDDGLTQYYYKGNGFTLGLGVQTEDKDGNNIDTVQAGGEYKIGGFKGQIALVKDKNGDNNGQILGARVWYTLDEMTLSAFTHRASDSFDYKSSNLCSGEKTSTNGIYGAYKTGVHKIHARFAVNKCDQSGDKASRKIEYVNALDKQFQVWVALEKLDTSRTTNDTVAKTELGVRYDF